MNLDPVTRKTRLAFPTSTVAPVLKSLEVEGGILAADFPLINTFASPSATKILALPKVVNEALHLVVHVRAPSPYVDDAETHFPVREDLLAGM